VFPLPEVKNFFHLQHAFLKYMRISNKVLIDWSIFILLSFIWGSSFILMKLGLYDSNGQPVLTAYQVAALRLFSAGLVLLPFAVRSFRAIPDNKKGFVVLSGLLGSFFPAFLFCIAETKIDSALAGTLNALTPVFVIITGFLLYQSKTSKAKIIGVLVALTGSFLLLLTRSPKANDNIGYAGFVLIATVLYGFNVNMVRHRLQQVGSLHIATLAFVFLTVPSGLILWFTHFFQLPLAEPVYLKATAASVVLGVAGTAIASILFYVLVKRAGGIFASMVTYGIPFIAIFWGLIYNEQITWLQVASLGVILAGVYIANK
jgi:drug/metabolite transporter (DMT)-like permease